MQLGNPPQAQSAGQFVTQIMPRVLEAGQSFALHALIPPQPHQDMPALYRRVDLFCLPSWWEAMPLTVLEAMAAGLPVVATSVGDIARMVEDGVTGRLVPPHQPEALAGALEPLLRNVELRRAMGRAARQTVNDRFNLSGAAAALDLLYREALT